MKRTTQFVMSAVEATPDCPVLFVKIAPDEFIRDFIAAPKPYLGPGFASVYYDAHDLWELHQRAQTLISDTPEA